MKIPKADAAGRAKFYTTLSEGLERVPFGTYTKKDLECLLLHAFIKAGIIGTERSRDMANILGINETKLKSYLVDIRYKYLADTSTESIKAIVNALFIGNLAKISHERIQGNGYFLFAIENPVHKIDFEQAMKDLGYFSDSSFNKEVVKVRDYALIDFLFKHHCRDDAGAALRAQLQQARADEQEWLKVIADEASWFDIGKRVLDVAGEAYDKLGLLRKIALLVSTGSFG